MMKLKLGFLMMILFAAFGASAQTQRYKCLIQMSNYTGEGAYITVSLIDPKGNYEKTLSVMGNDKKWYSSIKEWHKFYVKKPAGISGVTGASLSGGARTVALIEVETVKLDKGYKLRFETAVEDNKYYKDEVEVPFSTDAMSSKADGKGYIRYVKFSK